METWYEVLLEVKSVRMSEALIRMMSTLFSHAERLGWRPSGSNPCFRLGIQTPGARDRVVSWAEQDHLVATADRLGRHSIALAVLLSVYQGQRGADVLMVAPDDFKLIDIQDPDTKKVERNWIWELARSKRSTVGAMRLHPDIVGRVRRAIAALPADAPRLLVDEAVGRPYMLQDTDEAYEVTLFHKRFGEVRAAAAIDMPQVADIQFRDFRRTFGQRSRMGGVGRDDVGDVLGNSAARDFQLGNVYMGPQFETATRAVMAIRRPDQPNTGKKKA